MRGKNTVLGMVCILVLPVTLTVTVIGMLGVALYYKVKHNVPFKETVMNLAQGLKAALKTMKHLIVKDEVENSL